MIEQLAAHLRQYMMVLVVLAGYPSRFADHQHPIV